MKAVDIIFLIIILAIIVYTFWGVSEDRDY